MVLIKRKAYLVRFDWIKRQSWFPELKQPEHGCPTTDASHLTRLLLHLSQAGGLRELRAARRGAGLPLETELLDGGVSIAPVGLPFYYRPTGICLH